MANFKTHITTSTICGIAYGAYGYLAGGFSAANCIVAAGLGSVAGMLPDLDSDNGVPVRETFCLASAVIPVLMLDRFMLMGMTHEEMVIAAGAIYFLVRFGVAWIFKRYTVHRGMWHSVPACAICGLLAYMICSCDERVRIFKAFAVVVGFMSHLILDEIYSVDLRNRRIKKSFGTAVKFFGNKWWPNVSAYGKLALLVLAVTVGERKFLEYFEEPANRFHYTAERVAHQAHGVVDHVLGHSQPSGNGFEDWVFPFNMRGVSNSNTSNSTTVRRPSPPSPALPFAGQGAPNQPPTLTTPPLQPLQPSAQQQPFGGPLYQR